MSKKPLFFLLMIFVLLLSFNNIVLANTSGTNIIISEVEYDPTAPENVSEWFELYNPTGNTIDISGWTIKEFNTPFYTFPALTTIDSGDYLLVVNDTTNFHIEHPAITPDLDMDGGGCYSSTQCIRLNNTGDELTLKDDLGTTIDFVAWEDHVVGWPVDAGPGESACRTVSTDTDLGADWTNCVAPTPGSGTLATINQDPTDIKLDAADADSVDENTASGVNISVLTTIDSDLSDTHTYSLVAGVGDEDNAKFVLTGTNNEDLQLAFTPDFETPTDLGDTAGNNTYSIRLETDDGNGGTYEEAFIITVNDLNAASTNIDVDAADTDSQDENVVADSVIGVLTSADDGENNPVTYTYSLGCAVAGVDDAHFNIIGTDLRNTTVFDFEVPVDADVDNTYEICVRVNDGTLDYDENLTVTVNDVNEVVASSGGGGGGIFLYLYDEDEEEEAVEVVDTVVEVEAVVEPVVEEIPESPQDSQGQASAVASQQDEVSFVDVEGHWCEGYVEDLGDRDVISGKEEGMFEPDAYITRAEIVKMAVLAFEVPILELDEMAFPDVDFSEWSFSYIGSAYVEEIIHGYGDGLFRPNKHASRAEALKILVEAAKYYSVEDGLLSEYTAADQLFYDVMLESWYSSYVSYAKNNDLVVGYDDGTFGPDKKITRAEVAKLISELLEMYE